MSRRIHQWTAFFPRMALAPRKVVVLGSSLTRRIHQWATFFPRMALAPGQVIIWRSSLSRGVNVWATGLPRTALCPRAALILIVLSANILSLCLRMVVHLLRKKIKGLTLLLIDETTCEELTARRGSIFASVVFVDVFLLLKFRCCRLEMLQTTENFSAKTSTFIVSRRFLMSGKIKVSVEIV